MSRIFLMDNPILSWLNDSVLSAMGLNKLYIYFGIVFIFVIICYFLIEPIITWFVALESIKLLSYIVTSLVVIVLFLIAILVTDQLEELRFSLLKLLLQSLASLGIVIILIRGIQSFIRRT